MSTYATLPVSTLSDTSLTNLDKLVLAALRSHARPNKPLVWPSRTRLAAMCNCALASVSRSIKRLIAAGWIVVRRTGRANRVTVFDTATGHICSDPEVTSPPYSKERSEEPPYPPQGEAVVALPEPAPVAVETSALVETPAPALADQEGDVALIVAYLCTCTGRQPASATPQRATARLIKRRIARYGVDALKAVIDYRARLWRGTEFEQYLTPRTIFKPLGIEQALDAMQHAQQQADAARARALEKEREVKASIALPVQTEASREIALSALASLRNMLRGG